MSGLGTVETDPWREQLGPLLEQKAVEELLRLRDGGELGELVRRREILALPGRSEALVFPAFQFDSSGVLYPAVAAVLATFAAAEIEPHTLASWFRTPQSLLEGQSPASWLARSGAPEPLVEAARRTARRFSR